MASAISSTCSRKRVSRGRRIKALRTKPTCAGQPALVSCACELRSSSRHRCGARVSRVVRGDKSVAGILELGRTPRSELTHSAAAVLFSACACSRSSLASPAASAARHAATCAGVSTRSAKQAPYAKTCLCARRHLAAVQHGVHQLTPELPVAVALLARRERRRRRLGPLPRRPRGRAAGRRALRHRRARRHGGARRAARRGQEPPAAWAKGKGGGAPLFRARTGNIPERRFYTRRSCACCAGVALRKGVCRRCCAAAL